MTHGLIQSINNQLQNYLIETRPQTIDYIIGFTMSWGLVNRQLENFNYINLNNDEFKNRLKSTLKAWNDYDDISVSRLRDVSRQMAEVLKSVKTAILEADPVVVTDTLWMSERLSKNETVVDYIDAALTASAPKGEPAAYAGVAPGHSDPPDRREIVARELRRFHRNSCYPDASDGEVAIGVRAILAALNEIDHK